MNKYIKKTRPDFFSEWHYVKNNDIDPSTISASSKKKVWWKCKNGHEYMASLYDRNRTKKHCAECNSIAVKMPYLLKEWNYKKNNISPNKTYVFSTKEVWWKCKNNHEWIAKISLRSLGWGALQKM